MTTQICPDCSGAGKTVAIDWDEHGYHSVALDCEGCRGGGELRDCLECWSPVPANEAPFCDGCATMLGSQDQADEMARIRRVA